MSVQLDEVELVFFGMLADILQTRIDEYTNTLAPRGQVSRTFTDIAVGLRPEDEAHKVDAQGLGLTDVLRFSHTTYFDDHS